MFKVMNIQFILIGLFRNCILWLKSINEFHLLEQRIIIPQNTITLFFHLLKQNRVIVPDGIHESYSSKNIYHKDPKFSDRSSGHTVQTKISLLRRNQSD